jgi:hypothetical protein
VKNCPVWRARRVGHAVIPPGVPAVPGTPAIYDYSQLKVARPFFSEEVVSMVSNRKQTSDVARLLVLICGIGWANVGVAQVNLTFESPPYTAGNTIVGQDGWVYNNYATDPLLHNGTADISSVSPLDEAQSLLFTQTSVLANGVNDISKPNVITVPGGRVGSDLNVSYLMTGTSSLESPHGGIYLSTSAATGSSPIFAKVSNGALQIGGTFVSGTPIGEFAYFDEPLEVKYDVDFDTSTYAVTISKLDGSGEVHAATYNYGTFAAEGPGGEYVVDVGAILRAGTVAIDKLTLAPGAGPFMDVLTWTSNASGNWNINTNWTPAGIPGTIPGRQVAAFGSAITSPQTVYTSTNRTLNRMEFDNANSYAISGVGVIGFQADTSQGAPVLPVVLVNSGSHQIQNVVSILDNTTVTALNGSSLDFNNTIQLGGKTLTLNGDIGINHSITGGGTVVNLGSASGMGATDIGGDFVNVGTLRVGADASGAGSFSVLGDATLSGILDVEWDRTSLPTGTMTILSAAGQLNADDIALDPSDVQSFALGVSGNDLTLTFLGVAVPEPASVMLCLTGLLTVVFLRQARKARPALLVGLLAFVASMTQSAHAQVITPLIDFESYTNGPIAGQNGWNANVYNGVPIPPNGPTEVSTNSPLTGSRSLLYTQTSGGGGSDVSKSFMGFGTEDGTAAVDLTTSFQISAAPNAASSGGHFVGAFFTNFLSGGQAPYGLRLFNGGIDILSTGGYVPTGISYTAGHVLEFQFGINLDGTPDYEISYRNITTGAPLTPIPGTTAPGGRWASQNPGGGLPSDGDGSTYTLDFSTLFRTGTGKIDNITVTGDALTTAQWDGGSGDWSANTSWIPQFVPNAPTGNAQVVTFGTLATAAQSVFTNTAQTVNGLRFENANKYAIGGNGSIVLKSNTVGGTVTPVIEVLDGSHELQVAVNLLNNTAVTTTSTGLLDFNNTVNLGGNSLTNSGSGAINLNVGVMGGGSIINSGTLGTAGTTPIAANLTSTGKLQIDLGAANTDFFSITGNATVSGLLDVVLEPGYTPAGTYTVLTSSGTLNAAGLTLDPSDAGQFSLGVTSNSLVLTVAAGVQGDYNGNGIVDAADYTVWRDNLGGSSLPNRGDGIAGAIGQADYNFWKSRFGATSGSGAGGVASVPEPCCLSLVIVTIATAGLGYRRNRHTS